MSKYIPKFTNQTALTLANLYPTFAECIQAASQNQYKKDLRIKDDPQSALHILVEYFVRGTIKDKFKIEKSAVEQANHDRLALYQLTAVVLNHFDAHKHA